MSKIFKSLYTDYFQKSRMFLYPHLEIKRGSSIVPIETYISYEGIVSETDRKLVCLYYIRQDKEFSNFEQKHLLGNKLFDQYIELDSNRALYIFDFNSSEYASDYDKFIGGYYSIISEQFKKRIKEFYTDNKTTLLYIDSWLNPERYYEEYAGLLYNEDEKLKGVEILKKAVQLCPKPDINKESLILEKILNES